MFATLTGVQEALGTTGYITDEITSTVVYLASVLKRPILTEGPAGSGKTDLAYAIAKAADTEVVRLQYFEGISEERAIEKFDESLQRLAVELRSNPAKLNGKTSKQNCTARHSSQPGHYCGRYDMSAPAYC